MGGIRRTQTGKVDGAGIRSGLWDFMMGVGAGFGFSGGGGKRGAGDLPRSRRNCSSSQLYAARRLLLIYVNKNIRYIFYFFRGEI